MFYLRIHPSSQTLVCLLYSSWSTFGIMSIISSNGGFVTRHLRAPGADEFDQYGVATTFQARPGFNNTGMEVNVQVNSYPVIQYPTKTVYQFDVSVSVVGLTTVLLTRNRSISEMGRRSGPSLTKSGSLGQPERNSEMAGYLMAINWPGHYETSHLGDLKRE